MIHVKAMQFTSGHGSSACRSGADTEFVTVTYFPDVRKRSSLTDMEAEVSLETRRIRQSPFEVIIERHPEQAGFIRRLLVAKSEFRQLCDDYVMLREMIAELEVRSSTDQHELRSEYAQLSTELEPRYRAGLVEVRRHIRDMSVSRTPRWRRVTDVLAQFLQISLVFFMGGSLLGMGLALQLKDALTGIADLRFGILMLLLGFVLSPALAIALAWLLRLDPAYASGLLLLGMTPCAPFLSTVVEHAKGDRTRSAASLLISAMGTIILLPIAVPVAIPGLAVDAWTIARPLLLLVFLPLVFGMLLLRTFPGIAKQVQPSVRLVTSIATIVMLVLCADPVRTGLPGHIGNTGDRGAIPVLRNRHLNSVCLWRRPAP